jgi:hypothetical protein
VIEEVIEETVDEMLARERAAAGESRVWQIATPAARAA